MNTIEEAIEQILATFNNRIRRESRIKELDSKVKDFVDNRAEAKAALTALFKNGEVEARIAELKDLAGFKTTSANTDEEWRRYFGRLNDRISALQASLKEDV